MKMNNQMEGNPMIAGKIALLKEFLPALEQRYKEQILSAFSAHDLLTAYIRATVAADIRSDGIDAGEAARDMLYSVDEAAEREIKRHLADLSDDDYENELER